MEDTFTVVLKDQDWVDMAVPPGVTLTVKRYSSSAIGGPEKAEIEAKASDPVIWSLLNWLGYGVVILNPHGTQVWWGRIWDSEVQVGRIIRGATLQNMFNKIEVEYSYLNEGGSPSSGRTGWATDGDSIDRYGTRELRHQMGNGDGGSPIAKRDLLLNRLRYPKATRRRASSSASSPKATLRCKGWWGIFDDRYYSNPSGIEEYTSSGDQTQLIGWTLTANTISFDNAQKTISDSGNRLGNLQKSDKVIITGSGSNNVTFTVESAQDGQIRVIESVNTEAAGANVTLNIWGSIIAQQFEATNFLLSAKEVCVRVAKIGAPTDNLVIDIQSDSGGNAPSGTILSSAQIDPLNIYSTMGWAKGTLTTSLSMSPGTKYWVVVRRNGTSGAVNFYKISMDTKLGYTYGIMKLRRPDGIWVTRSPDADMPFRVLDLMDIATQILFMYSSMWPFGDHDVTSGILSNSWRSGNNKTQKEIVKLLEILTTSGRRMLTNIMVDKTFQLYLEPLSDAYSLAVRGDNEFLYPSSQSLLPTGVLPVGQWVQETDLPTNLDVLVESSLVFIEWAEYDHKSGTIDWLPRDSDDLLSLPSMERG